jgi:hypothetical protein
MIINLDAWEKLPTQEKIYYDDKTETLMQSAGLGSGKSYALCRKLLKLSAINRHVPGGVLAPTFSDYKRDIEPMMEGILRDSLGMIEGKHYKYNRTDKTWRFCWSKAPLYVFTAERPIAGPNLGWAGVNEFSMIPYERLKEFLRRVRIKDVPIKQKLLVGTPEDLYAYLEEFVSAQEEANKKRPNSFRLVHASTTENTFIDENYADHLRSTLDPRALEVFLSGQIVRLHGDYFYYAFTSDLCVTDLAIYMPDADVHAAMDFNIGRMTTTFWQKAGAEARCFDELVLTGNSDTPAMARAIAERFDRDKVILHLDASAKNRSTKGRSDLKILQDFGYKNIRFKAVNPRMRDRQLLVNGKMSRGEIKIHPSCKALIKDCKSVRQVKEDFTKDKKVPELTHASDTMDYFLDFEYPLDIKRQSSSIQL